MVAGPADDDHVQTVSNSERYGALVFICEILHERPRNLPDGKLTEHGITEREDMRVQPIAARILVASEKSQCDQRIGQPRDRWFRKSGSLNQLPIAEAIILGFEDTQEIQAPRQRLHELAVIFRPFGR